MVRVHELVPAEMWSSRYNIINRFEGKLVVSGTRIVKCFLRISRSRSPQVVNNFPSRDTRLSTS